MPINIAEFRGLRLSRPDPLVSEYATAQAPDVPAVAYQSIATAGTASAAFDNATTLVRVVSDAACYIDIAVTPDANSDTMYLPADVVAWFSMPTNSGLSIDTAAAS